MKIIKLLIVIWFFVTGVLFFFMSLAIMLGQIGAGIVCLLVSIPWMHFSWRGIKECIADMENKK